VSAVAWAVPSPASKYGGAFVSPSHTTQDNSPLTQIAGPSAADAGTTNRLSPKSPMFWAGLAILGTVGLAAVSTTVRVGPAKAELELGDV
jgi:hypothetical protein